LQFHLLGCNLLALELDELQQIVVLRGLEHGLALLHGLAIIVNAVIVMVAVLIVVTEERICRGGGIGHGVRIAAGQTLTLAHGTVPRRRRITIRRWY